MRIWDLPPNVLCNKHLLGEHRELHGLFNILTQNKKGYSQHPETKRWVGRTKALFNRHEELAKEMAARGFKHNSPLCGEIDGPETNERRLHTELEQIHILINKGCQCNVCIS